MAGRTRIGAALATAAVGVALAAPPGQAALAPVHNRHAAEHAIHQKEKELLRVKTRARLLYEGWLDRLARRVQQKQARLDGFAERAAVCEGADAGCGGARDLLVSEEKERLSGEIQADESLAAEPEPGEAPAAKRVLRHAQVLEEGIRQREAELASLPASAARAKR